MENETSTGGWLRDLARLVDQKDALIKEQAERINYLTQHRLVVGWMHPHSRRLIHADQKTIAEQSFSANGNDLTKITSTDRDRLQHTVPIFVEIDPAKRGWE